MSVNQQENNEELTCKPLDSYNDILEFLENPPSWRSLCKELTPHSESKIKNMEINKHYDIHLEAPETFCHFNPDAEDPVRCDRTYLPKTLVCHDMANGYADDSFIDGTGQHDAFNFYNWAGIDIFCYFSHHLITIPPLSWINIGHAHGVKVIGTVITEWSEGMDFWDEILQTETKYHDFASALVAIAKTLRFDGWLLNVENKITKPDMLLDFVRYFNSLLHQEIPHAELIWYDSVTVLGHLNWQNGLNEKNRAFFDACDGIFTNYSWTEFDITTSSIEAGDRVRDLYIGIDVWGRNFYGGGEFNTQAAVKLVYEQGCSMAIFAPAWSHEAMADDTSDVKAVVMGEQLDRGEQFRLRDRALWGSIWPFLNTSLPCVLPFQTSFCRGQGKKRRLHGEVICPGPWYNLRHQQYQPNSAHGPHGYMLSTQDNILHITRQSVFKDPKGIIRYRESFIASRSEPPPTSVSPAADEPAELSEERQEVRFSKAVKPADRKTGFAPVESMSLKSKLKRALTNLFKSTKSAKTAEETANREEPEEPEREDDAEASTSSARTSKSLVMSTGKSMVTISVNLRLKQDAAAAKVRYGLALVAAERECLQLWEEDSFTGGACLRVHPSDVVSKCHRTARLFHCEFRCGPRPLIACVVTKPQAEAPAQRLHVYLHVRLHGRRRYSRLVLLGAPNSASARPAHHHGPATAMREVAPLDCATPRFHKLQNHLLLHHPEFYVPVENLYGWVVRYYEMSPPEGQVVSINLRTEEPQGPILLGHFGLCVVDY